MSTLEDLIAELCPGGVKYRALAGIASYSTERIDATVVDSRSYVGVDNLLPDKQGKTDSDYVPAEGRLICFSKGDILIGNIRPYLKKIWLATYSGGTNGDVLVIKANNRKVVSPEFLFYVLSSDTFFIYDMQHAKGAKMPRGDKSAVMKYRVPLPPLPIQREIVRILDTFTELTAELTAELAARETQYEHYRDSLLAFDDDSQQGSTVKWLAIGEICDISRGRVISKDFIRANKGEYPVYSSQTEDDGVLGTISGFDYEGEYLTWTTDGANAGSIFHRNGKFSITNVCGLLKPNTDVATPRYLYYALGNRASKHVNRGMGNPKLMSNVMSKIKVPVPPLEEQEHIVAILDRFDALCNDLTNGLPAEIEARRKQYEYYRDRLLTFKEAMA
jgi:type I restriction enzyme S subunit